MAKLGSKLKCMMKRWRSSSRINRGGDSLGSSNDGEGWLHASSFNGDEVPAGFHTVYVGKSRRRYLISSQLVDHPLFQVLIARSGGGGGANNVVGCEVVLFEHLLWMLENADPQPESLDELVEFYA